MRYSDKTLDEITQRLENLAIDLRALQKRQNDPLTRQELQQARNLIGIARDLVAGKLAYEAPGAPAPAALPVDPAPPERAPLRGHSRWCISQSLPANACDCKCRACGGFLEPSAAEHVCAPAAAPSPGPRFGECPHKGRVSRDMPCPDCAAEFERLRTVPASSLHWKREYLTETPEERKARTAAASSGNREHEWTLTRRRCRNCKKLYRNAVPGEACPGKPPSKHSASTALSPSDSTKGPGGAERADRCKCFRADCPECGSRTMDAHGGKGSSDG